MDWHRCAGEASGATAEVRRAAQDYGPSALKSAKMIAKMTGTANVSVLPDHSPGWAAAATDAVRYSSDCLRLCRIGSLPLPRHASLPESQFVSAVTSQFALLVVLYSATPHYPPHASCLHCVQSESRAAASPELSCCRVQDAGTGTGGLRLSLRAPTATAERVAALLRARGSLPPLPTVTAAVVWLHGLGDTGVDRPPLLWTAIPNHWPRKTRERSARSVWSARGENACGLRAAVVGPQAAGGRASFRSGWPADQAIQTARRCAASASLSCSSLSLSLPVSQSIYPVHRGVIQSLNADALVPPGRIMLDWASLGRLRVLPPVPQLEYHHPIAAGSSLPPAQPTCGNIALLKHSKSHQTTPAHMYRGCHTYNTTPTRTHSSCGCHSSARHRARRRGAPGLVRCRCAAGLACRAAAA